MNKLLILITALLSLSLQTFSQVTPTWAWGADYSGDVISTTYHDNHIYVIGNYYDTSIQMGSVILPNAGGFDTYIAKWDTLGNLIWAKSISDTGSQDLRAIHVNSNNEIVIAGNNSSPNLIIGNDTIGTSLPGNGFVAKLDLNGNVIDAFKLNGINDMCIDNSDTIYVATVSGLSKYSNSGVLIWQKPIPMQYIRYSSVGNCLIGTGSFNFTLTIGGFSITAYYSSTWGNYPDVFCVKTDLNGNVNWLLNISNSARWDIHKSPYLQESTGELYVPFMFLGMGGQYANIIKITPSGSTSYLPLSNTLSGVVMPSLNSNDLPEILNISGKDSLISYMLITYGISSSPSHAFCIFNLNTQQTTLALNCRSNYHFFNGLNSIYMNGQIGSIVKTFGKLGPNLLTSPQTSLGHHYCSSTAIGTTMQLNSNVIGGVPPLTYSWAPSAGLSSTTNDTTSFIVSSSVSYTLTVTDAISQVVKDTFAITLDTTLGSLSISPQYPTFCHDSMYLNTNLGINVQWYKFNGSYWVFNSPLPVSQNTIFSAGLYRADGWNSCGSVSDTLEIHPTVDVNANASSADFCLGQSITLSGSGAQSYSWSGGVINNTSFNPTTTTTYTVTGTDSSGCVDTASIQIMVRPTPTIATITATPAILCTGGSSILSMDQSISYCSPTAYYPGANGDYLTNVNFGSGLINNTTGDGPGDYNYYTTLNANVTAGAMYPILISTNSSTAKRKSVWIDFNQDGIFDEINEKVFYKDSSAVNVSGNILIPINAFNGKTRMRVASKNYYGSFKPCYIDDNGEFEDYNITISGGVDNIQWSPSTFLSTTNGAQVQATNVSNTTTYTVTVNSAYGCSNSGTVTLTVNPISSSTTNTTICSSDLPYLWNTLSINSSGTYSDYFLNTSGCDSTAILNLTVNSTSTSSTNSIICSSDIPYAWNTQILTSSGVYTTTLSNASGCDSIATLNLIVNQSNISTMDTTICSTASPYVWNSQNLTTSGVYTMSLVNSSGCDSIATLNLTVISTSASTTDTTICSTDLPFVWNTQSLTTSGYYTSQFTNVLGCDSISTLNLTVNQSSASTTNASVCVTALPYTWNSQTYTATGIYASVFTNSVGCDSISILDLIVNTLSTSNTNTAICSTALPYVWNSQSLTSTGIYTSTFTNTLGCDSIATLNLTVNSTSASATNTTICSTTLPYVWNTQSLTTSGTYTSTFINTLGCDSIATLNLTVNPSSASTTNVTICSTTLPYVWNTQSLTASGVYTSTFTNAVGCDSVATLNLTVNPTSTSTTNTTICSSSLPYVWNSQSLTSTGIYTSTFINAVGCDSIATLNFTVNPIPIVTIIPGSDSTICIGASYILEVDNSFVSYAWSLNSSSISSVNTVAITDSGTYIVSCVDSNGCIGYDSVHIYMTPIPDPLIVQSNDTLICTNANNVSYLWHFNGANIGTDSALIITQNGVYYVKVTDSIGCIGFDTLVVIGLGMNDISSSGGILIYPNPTSDFITIECNLKETAPLDLKLLDAQGRIVWSKKYEKKTPGIYSEQINLKSLGLKSGTYLLIGRTLLKHWTTRIVFLEE